MRLLLLAVVVAQALDAITFAAMPRAHEVNPIVRGMHTEAAWLAKALLVVLVIAIQPALRPRYAAVGEGVALVAIAAGFLGAGSNMAVLTTVAAEAPRSALEPALVARAATGIEQGHDRPAAPERTPAPSARRGARAPDIRGVASWYAAPASTAAAGPALRRALGPGWRGTWVLVSAGARSVAVRLDDVCGCYGTRVIDLSDDDFAVLAPLSTGVVRVRVSLLVPPATDR